MVLQSGINGNLRLAFRLQTNIPQTAADSDLFPIGSNAKTWSSLRNQ
jgi:hypothetical protein